jgi:hypothetical protein
MSQKYGQRWSNLNDMAAFVKSGVVSWFGWFGATFLVIIASCAVRDQQLTKLISISGFQAYSDND